MRAAEIPDTFALGEKRPLLVMDVPDWERCVSESGGFLARRLDRWVSEARWQLLAHHKGRIAGRLRNGLVMEFADARSCLRAAFALGQLADSVFSPGHAKHVQLRAGAHLPGHDDGHIELSGRGASLTSAVAALAQPGEVLVSAELRSLLVNGFDADFEELDPAHLVPSNRAVRLFRAHPRPEHSTWSEAGRRDLRPGLAVIPFEGGIPEAKRWMVGEMIAEGVIARLSRSVGIRVISRNSTSALRGCDGLTEVERYLGATFVLSGHYSIHGKRLLVDAELAEVHTHKVFWTGQLQQRLDDLLHEDSELLFQLAHGVAKALGNAQVGKLPARQLPFGSNMLLSAGLSMMHSDSPETLKSGRQILTELTVRHTDHALPKAWLGMWYALRVITGKSSDVAADTRRAREQTLRALEAEPESAIALAVEGYIQCQLLGDSRQAHRYLNAAIEANPSEPMAWLLKSLVSCMWSSSAMSVAEASIARALSPIDPLQYFFDLLTGNALLADRQHAQAIRCFRKSLRVSKHHAPTLRLLATAQAELGEIDEGKETLRKLRAEVPDLTVSSYLAMGSSDSPIRQRSADALRQLGLPEN